MNNEAEPPATLLGAAVNSTIPTDGAATAAEAEPSQTRNHRRRRLGPHRHSHARSGGRYLNSKIQFLGQILRSLDIIVYYYFAYMYFLDTSFFRFLIRSSVQLNCLTPKPAAFLLTPQKRSIILGIFGSTAFCVLNHAFFRAPEAGEAYGGYLHGGFIIDFVGQESPVSKFRLFATDATILLLQVFMLSLTLERQKLRVLQSTPSASATTQTPLQDHDNEERGQLRASLARPDQIHYSSSEDNENDDDTVQEREEQGESEENQQSRPELRRQGGGGVDGEREHLLSDENQDYRTDERSWNEGRYDAYSGQLVVANVRLIDAIRFQWTHGTPIPGETIGGRTFNTSASGSGNTAASRLSALAQLSRRGAGL